MPWPGGDTTVAFLQKSEDNRDHAPPAKSCPHEVRHTPAIPAAGDEKRDRARITARPLWSYALAWFPNANTFRSIEMQMKRCAASCVSLRGKRHESYSRNPASARLATGVMLRIVGT